MFVAVSWLFEQRAEVRAGGSQTGCAVVTVA
jgi:hypothetical protein